MVCLTNYIGLKGCGSIEPQSGLYVNSLAGITSEILEAAASREQITGRLAWDDVQTVAQLRLFTDSLTALRKKYTLRQVRENYQLVPSTGGVAEVASANRRGVRLSFVFTSYTFQSFILSTISFVSPAATAGLTFFILDKYGNVLHSKTVDVVIGMNTITIDKTFTADAIFVGVDGNKDGTLSSVLTEVDATCFCQSIRQFCTDCNPAIEGYTEQAGTFTKTSGNTHGIGVNIYVGCDYSSIICSNKELFTSSWLYLLGNQAIINLINSPRINKLTTVDRQRFVELRDFYQVEYEKQLAAAIEGIRLDDKRDCCVECNEPIKKVEWIP